MYTNRVPVGACGAGAVFLDVVHGKPWTAASICV